MAGTDLQLIDLDTRDPFDFYPAKYSAQLVAGYSKITPAKGLEVVHAGLRRSESLASTCGPRPDGSGKAR